MSGLRIAVVANRKFSIKTDVDAPPDALAEYDSEETVQSLLGALRMRGHTPFFLEADETFVDTVRTNRPDICFNIAEGLHGDSRESQVPALLEMLSIPYIGSKVLAHAVSLDKVVTKRIWRDAGLPTAPFQCFYDATAPLDDYLKFPLFVKPSHEGSGMGINANSIVRNDTELRMQVQWIIRNYHQPALVETFLSGREFTVGLVGNTRLPNQPRRSEFYDEHGFHLFPVLEIDSQKGAVKGLYNAEAKSYAIDDALAPGYLCPADIVPEFETKLYRLTIAAFEALGVLDFARVDFRLDMDGRPYLIEINSLPGINPYLSDLVIMARAENVTYETLVNEILDLARERYDLL